MTESSAIELTVEFAVSPRSGLDGKRLLDTLSNAANLTCFMTTSHHSDRRIP
jgi:hypothetical protein